MNIMNIMNYIIYNEYNELYNEFLTPMKSKLVLTIIFREKLNRNYWHKKWVKIFLKFRRNYYLNLTSIFEYTRGALVEGVFGDLCPRWSATSIKLHDGIVGAAWLFSCGFGGIFRSVFSWEHLRGLLLHTE